MSTPDTYIKSDAKSTLLTLAEDNQPYLTLPFNDHKITSAVWGPLGEFVIAGHENGEFNQISAKVKEPVGCGRAAIVRKAQVVYLANSILCLCVSQSGEIMKKAKEHSRHINDIQTSVDLTMFISASKDNTAKVRSYSQGRILTGCEELSQHIHSTVQLWLCSHCEP